VKYYLAYGMNTNLENMAERCPRARSLGKVVLKDHKLVFKHHADIQRSVGSEMECALWAITDDCEASLDMLEGYPFYYNKKTVFVEYRGSVIRAMVYFMTDNNLYAAPGASYLSMMQKGYSDHGMDLYQIERAHHESVVLA